MESEDQLCARYQRQFAAIAALDRRYYRNPCPTLAKHNSKRYALTYMRIWLLSGRATAG
jgi:hypothetical protein